MRSWLRRLFGRGRPGSVSFEDYRTFQEERQEAQTEARQRRDDLRMLRQAEHERALLRRTLTSSCNHHQPSELATDFTSVSLPAFAEMLTTEFGNPNVLRLAECFTWAHTYSDEDRNVLRLSLEYRVRTYLRSLERFGAESVYGFAFLARLGSDRESAPAFVVKTMRDPYIRQDALLHEYFVGKHLNRLRSQVPNFAYMLGKFVCSAPYLRSDGRGAIHWCASQNVASDERTLFVIYERIAPSVTYQMWIAEPMRTRNEILVSVLQLAQALLVAQQRLAFMHLDLHPENVLMRELATETEITLFGTKVRTRWIPTVIDYGAARIRVDDEVFANWNVVQNPYGTNFDSFVDMYVFLAWIFFQTVERRDEHGRVRFPGRIRLLYHLLAFAWKDISYSLDEATARIREERRTYFRPPLTRLQLVDFVTYAIGIWRPDVVPQNVTNTLSTTMLSCTEATCTSFATLYAHLRREDCTLQALVLRGALLKQEEFGCPRLGEILTRAKYELFSYEALFDRFFNQARDHYAIAIEPTNFAPLRAHAFVRFVDDVMEFLNTLDAYCLLYFQLQYVFRMYDTQSDRTWRTLKGRLFAGSDLRRLSNLASTQKARIQRTYDEVRHRAEAYEGTAQDFPALLNTPDQWANWFWSSFVPLRRLPALVLGPCPAAMQ